ncbi:hypothetical protein CERSUDRAFT_97987 [Gelatoporia subvermispora B]|uniref:Uncharacterized protein n=1 Tax=Ceriporiopsis subvermispora (strain B) TaxID=914234 RepID=M2R6V5_CERS8|nr:hypothetical protein CERSUDRAFT_97987 [Gelatoporia subvermispora B]
MSVSDLTRATWLNEKPGQSQAVSVRVQGENWAEGIVVQITGLGYIVEFVLNGVTQRRSFNAGDVRRVNPQT